MQIDARLLGELRKQAPSLRKKWLPDTKTGKKDASQALYNLETSLFPLLLDSMQFEGFRELDHLASRIGDTGWSEGTELGAILGSIFHLRLVLEEFFTKKGTGPNRSLMQSGINRQIDQFASACAQAYVQSSTHGATIESRKEIEKLNKALQALSRAVMIVDDEFKVTSHNTALCETLALTGNIKGRKFDEFVDLETSSMLHSMIDSAKESNIRATETIHGKKGTLLASATPLTGLTPALFLVEINLQAAKHVDAASALRQVLSASENRPAFGKLMKEIRREKELPMRSLAEQLGMARGYISNIENGKSVPSFKAIVKICELLDPQGERGLIALGVVQRLPGKVREKLAF